MRVAESSLKSNRGVVVDLEMCFYQEGVDDDYDDDDDDDNDDSDWVVSELEQRYGQSVDVEGHHERCVFDEDDDSCEYEEGRLSC